MNGFDILKKGILLSLMQSKNNIIKAFFQILLSHWLSLALWISTELLYEYATMYAKDSTSRISPWGLVFIEALIGFFPAYIVWSILLLMGEKFIVSRVAHKRICFAGIVWLLSLIEFLVLYGYNMTIYRNFEANADAVVHFYTFGILLAKSAGVSAIFWAVHGRSFE